MSPGLLYANMPFEQILASLSFTIAGSALFLILFSRVILHLEDGPSKTLATIGALLCLTTVPAALGSWLGFSRWLAVPMAIMAFVAGCGIRLLWFRYIHRAAKPVYTENAGVRFLKPVTTCDLALRRYEVACPRLSIPRLRIAHISDLHVNSMIPYDWYVLALNHVSHSEPDLVFMTGDFVSEPEYVDMLPDLLCHARGQSGTFGVLGNHDHWVGSDVVAEAVKRGGVTLLGNTVETVQLVSGHSATVAGCEAPWGPGHWLPWDTIVPNRPLFVLSHTADNIYRLHRAGATAVFTGHYHAGQIVLPVLGSLVIPSRFGRRFNHGHFNVNGTDLFVTAGMGASSPPLRIYCQPEIILVDFLRDPAAAVPLD